MNRTFRLILVGLFSCGATFAADLATDRASDHTALRALLVDVTAAMNSGDTDQLRTCLAMPFVITFVDQRRFTDVAAIEQYLDSLKRERHLEKWEMKPSADALTTFLSDEVGVCTGTSNDTFTFAEGSISLSSRWTATLVKEQGAWKVAALQAGVNILDNPILASAASMGKKIAIGAAIVALALGLFLGLVLGRRRAH
jgi:hypothetical protein